jgi:geranylgeranyl diphosphate synthase type I
MVVETRNSCLRNIMALTPTIQETLFRYQREIQGALREAVERNRLNSLPSQGAPLIPFYGQMQYHLGWVDSAFSPIPEQTGKLLRPTLLLLAYEAAGAEGLSAQAGPTTDYLRRALPAAAALELTHNFSLIHDDIVDNDTERHHRPTVWTIWGKSQGINAGDGMFAMGRLALWGVLEQGVSGEIAARAGAVLDRACLVIAEGQYLDMSFEQRQDISVSMYLDMINRKTAALLSCAAEIGGLLGTNNPATIESLRDFGFEIGVAFQVRDDMLGVWASEAELGKTSAGDIYRRKKSLPVLHALEQANSQDQQTLRQLYTQEAPLREEQIATVLAIFGRSKTQAYCLAFLHQLCTRARQALDNIPRLENQHAARALRDMQTLVDFIEGTIR